MSQFTFFHSVYSGFFHLSYHLLSSSSAVRFFIKLCRFGSDTYISSLFRQFVVEKVSVTKYKLQQMSFINKNKTFEKYQFYFLFFK